MSYNFICFLFFEISIIVSNTISEIRLTVEHINNQTNLKKVEYKDVFLYKHMNKDTFSIEGSTLHNLAMINLNKLYDSTELKKIVVYCIGDYENLISEYYSDNNNLIYVNKSLHKFLKPKWHDEFDSTKFLVFENQYYFNNNTIIEWINEDNQLQNINDTFRINEEKIILHDYYIYKNYKE